MEDLKFVVRCLLVTMLIVVFMQIKVGRTSIESYTFHWLRTSSTSQFMQSVAAGGVMAIKNLGGTMKRGVSDTVDNFREGSHDKAIR